MPDEATLRVSYAMTRRADIGMSGFREISWHPHVQHYGACHDYNRNHASVCDRDRGAAIEVWKLGAMMTS